MLNHFILEFCQNWKEITMLLKKKLLKISEKLLNVTWGEKNTYQLTSTLLFLQYYEIRLLEKKKFYLVKAYYI